MTECTEHHYYEMGRCLRCQIQSRYYAECIAMLNSWPKKEKESEEWKRKVDALRCKPHTHEEAKERRKL